MGMAASQARLLSITSRIADNELRAQIINNSKMRLATESSKVSEQYVSALNDATMMMSNYDTQGNSQYQKLTFNGLTSYSSHNNQYGLINANGKLLVKEDDAIKFKEANGNLDSFLNEYGLVQTTSFFTELGKQFNEIDLNIYDENNNPVGGIDRNYTIADLEEMYFGDGATHKGYNASLESAQYAEYVNLYNEYVAADEAFDIAAQKYAQEDVYNSTYYSKLDKRDKTYTEHLDAVNAAEDNNAGWVALNEAYLFIAGKLNDTDFKNSYNAEFRTALGGKNHSFTTMAVANNDTENAVYCIVTSTPGIEATTTDNNTFTLLELSESAKITVTKQTTQPDEKTPYLQDQYGNYYTIKATNDDDNKIGFYTPWQQDGADEKYFVVNQKTTDGSSTAQQYRFLDFKLSDDGKLTFKMYHCNPDFETAKSMVLSALKTYAKAANNLNDEARDKYKDKCGNEYNTYNAAKENLEKFIFGTKPDNTPNTPAGFDPNKLGDIEFIINYHTENNISLSTNFQVIHDIYVLDQLFNEYGEPAYGWIDNGNAEENADAKVQWYTNLFERMQKGYTVLEDGLASSNKWIEFALESGLVTMEQVDNTKNWVATTHTNCSDITEVTDEKAVAVAEAEYNKAMNNIENKDKRFDMELKNIDTEHNSLQTEYDSVKSVIDKNIQRSFKIYA